MELKQPIKWSENCPVCKGKMAKGNRYCSLKCYREDHND